MKRGMAWGIILLLAASGSSLGAAPLELSLDEAIRRALGQSIDLQKSSLDLGAAEYAARRQWSEFFPTLNLGAAFNYGTNLFSGAGFSAAGDQFSYSASAELRLAMNAGLPDAMKLLELAYQAQLLSYEDVRRRIEIQVTKTFFSLLTGKVRLAHLEKMAEAAALQREKSRIAFENGLAGELTYLRSRLAAENTRLNLASQQLSYAAQLREFLALLGFGEDVEVTLEGALAISPVEADAEQLIPEYLPRRPDIVGQRQVIERLEREKRRTLLATYAPSLSLSLTGGWNSRPTPPAEQYSDSLRGGLTLSIPVDSFIPGTKTAQGLRTLDRNIEKARLDLKNVENNALNQIRTLTANLRNAWSTVEISRLQVQLAERTYELTEQGFQQGTVEYLTLEDTRNSMSEARQQLLSNELAYQNMILDLAAALNVDWKEL
jgi:multidrug efflux system outer membrane protein